MVCDSDLYSCASSTGCFHTSLPQPRGKPLFAFHTHSGISVQSKAVMRGCPEWTISKGQKYMAQSFTL